MTSHDPVQSPPTTAARRHVRIRTVPLRVVRFGVLKSLRLPDSRPVYLAAKKRGISEAEFMREAVMRHAANTLAAPNRRSA